MPTVALTRNESGKLAGISERDAELWARLRKRLEDLQPTEAMSLTWTEPRSPRHHRLWFAKLRGLFDLQEQFEDEEALRAWLIVGAGFADFVPGPAGRMVALPKSMAWHKMDEAGFQDLHRRVDRFMRSEHAQGFLWGHLSAPQRAGTVEGWIDAFAGET